MERTQANDLELGATHALQQHVISQHVASKPISQRVLNMEARRPRVLRECMAEATGVFFYVFPSIASVTSFTLHDKSPIGVTAFGSLFQIGWAFAIGIAFAIVTCGPTSGGYFNPAITICLTIWQGFPLKKVPHYIFSQIFGAFMASLLIMGLYWPDVSALKEANLAEHGAAVETNLAYLFPIEFFIDSFIGIVIWACLDPINPFVAPISLPFIIGLAYALMVWGFGGNTISTNLARDLGARTVAAIFFGRQVFTYIGYSWIAILVNVPATMFVSAYYEFLMRDSLQKIAKGHAEHAGGEQGLWKERMKRRRLRERWARGE